jgi:hypothetical protein
MYSSSDKEIRDVSRRAFREKKENFAYKLNFVICLNKEYRLARAKAIVQIRQWFGDG